VAFRDASDHPFLSFKFVRDWSSVSGDEVAVVGGYESGVDAAIHLARLGRKVHLFSRGKPWLSDSPDSSRSLSPFTFDRLRQLGARGLERIRFHADFDVRSVSPSGRTWVLTEAGGMQAVFSDAPILCTGYRGGLGLVAEHFEDETGAVCFTEEADESPRLFAV
jgi:putative flavoprotein involved in K+ transport